MNLSHNKPGVTVNNTKSKTLIFLNSCFETLILLHTFENLK